MGFYPTEKMFMSPEIVFGTGLLIKKLTEHLDCGLVDGIDFLKPMVALAQKKNRSHINKVEVQ